MNDFNIRDAQHVRTFKDARDLVSSDQVGLRYLGKVRGTLQVTMRLLEVTSMLVHLRKTIPQSQHTFLNTRGITVIVIQKYRSVFDTQLRQ